MTCEVYCLQKDEETVTVDHWDLPRSNGVNAIEIHIGGHKITIHGTDEMFTDLSVKISQAVMDSQLTKAEKESINVQV